MSLADQAGFVGKALVSAPDPVAAIHDNSAVLRGQGPMAAGRQDSPLGTAGARLLA